MELKKVKKVIICSQERDEKFKLFWGFNKKGNRRDPIIFDYHPTWAEQKMFESKTLKTINDVLKTRDLLALVKYYESHEQNKKNSKFNEFLLEELKKFRLAEVLTPENKAYLLINTEGRVDEIISELIFNKFS